MSKVLLILGAKSDIGLAIAHEFAAQGFNLILAARDAVSLNVNKSDLEVRYRNTVDIVDFDVLDYTSHSRFYEALPCRPDVVASVIGYLGEQDKAQSDFEHAHKIIDTNYTGPVSILSCIAEDMAVRKSGALIAVSSVAGDRGRPSNYCYGSAKGGLSLFLEGLAARMSKFGVKVLDVKPGFVATRMTAEMDLPQALVVEPEVIAVDVYKAFFKGKNVVYTPWFWTYIMLIIRNIPKVIFNRLSL
jgi:decaprenylphospho-beta-D-erythro-pentofuranosid-2-ulose 2-reductase